MSTKSQSLDKKLERFIYSLIHYRIKQKQKENQSIGDYVQWETIQKYLKKDFESIRRGSSEHSASSNNASPGTKAWVKLVNELLEEGIRWSDIEKELEAAYQRAHVRIFPTNPVKDLLSEGNIRSKIMRHMSVSEILKLVGKMSNDDKIDLIRQLNDPTSAAFRELCSWTTKPESHPNILKMLDLKAHTMDGKVVRFNINTQDAQGRTVFFGMIVCLIRYIYESYEDTSDVDNIMNTIQEIWKKRDKINVSIGCSTLDFNKQQNSKWLMKRIRKVFRFIDQPFRHTAFSLILYHLCIKDMGGYGPLYDPDLFEDLFKIVEVCLETYSVDQLYLKSRNRVVRKGLFGWGIDPKLLEDRSNNLSNKREITNVWIVENADDELFELLEEKGLDPKVSGVDTRDVKTVLENEVKANRKEWRDFLEIARSSEKSLGIRKQIDEQEKKIEELGEILKEDHGWDEYEEYSNEYSELLPDPYFKEEDDEILPKGIFHVLEGPYDEEDYYEYYRAHKELDVLYEKLELPRKKMLYADLRLDRAEERLEVNIDQAGGRHKATTTTKRKHTKN